jgi:alanine dehydrogenase
LAIAEQGIEAAIEADPALALGVNVWDGRVTNEGVAAATKTTFAALSVG